MAEAMEATEDTGPFVDGVPAAPCTRCQADASPSAEGSGGSGEHRHLCSKRRRVSFADASGGKRRATGVSPSSAATPCAAALQVGCRLRPTEAAAAVSTSAMPLAALAGGPYFTAASCLDAIDLCRVDATCRLLLTLNGLPAGPWYVVGDRAFFGMELDVGGGFLPFEQDRATPAVPSASSTSWKARCELFHRQAPTFSPPFSGDEIVNVEHPDEVAYCRCRLRADLLATRRDRGVYVEVEVLANADNLSLAVVDFEGGGRSSVTFSPETGAVLRERKVRESPRAIEGTYIHLLPAAPPGRRFEGTMGLYLHGGHLAFFRRWSGSGPAAAVPEEEAEAEAEAEGLPGGGGGASLPGQWETTGFCTDLRWARGPRLSMCLAFRDDGAYRVRVARVDRAPPSLPARSREAYQEDKWSLLYGDDDHPLAI
uniref:Uncharacterized protein n=1 Tax=Alexandrium monilatum TaxID=311494 RepID=A0A6T0ZC15_9DINO